MPKPQPFLSKTKYLDGVKCPKLLWYEYHRKKEIVPPSKDELEIMKQGQLVGELAQKLFPDGIKIVRDVDPLETERRSTAELAKRKPLFEAGFTHDQAYSLADILDPVGKDAWDLIEVKSTTRVKDEHLYDAAFQKYVYAGKGLNIRKCYLMRVNGDYVRKGELDLKKYFMKEDITAQTDKLKSEIKSEIAKMLKVIEGAEPKIKAGRDCFEGCPLEELCWDFLPEGHVFILRGRSEVAFDLMERGVLKLKDIPKNYDLKEKHTIQVKAHNSNRAYVDREAIISFIKELQFPLYFLDFETIAPAIPVYDGSHPYEDIPFQFSVHVLMAMNAKPSHFSYLAPGDVDPRPEILKRIKDLLGSSGSVMAYNAQYEIRCLKNCVEAYLKYAGWFKGIEKRIVDLLVPFRKLLYYHPDQEGSASMKNVLPALTGITYDNMEIGDGGTARFEYMRVTFGKEIAENERQRVRRALEKYCELDTLGMIEILKALRDQVNS